MANHKSSLKRIRQSEKRRLENRYWAKTARNAVRRVRRMTDKEEATAAYNKVSSLLQRLGRKNIISKTKRLTFAAHSRSISTKFKIVKSAA